MNLKLFLLASALLLIQNLAAGASLKSDSCGGSIFRSGEIRYKVGQVTSANELCVWTLINLDYPRLSIDMTEEGFADNGDHVEIFYYSNGSLLNPVPDGGPHCDGPILSRQGQLCLVPKTESALIFLVFRSNHALHGTGFVIKIEPSGLLQPSRNTYDPYTLPHPGNSSNFVDYPQEGFKSSKIVSWTLTNPSEFVLYRFNVTPPCPPNSTTSSSPSLAIFQATQGSPTRLELACGSISRPIRLIQSPTSGGAPLLLIYENGRRSYGWGEIKFYWDLDEPPAIWRPGRGGAASPKGGCGAVTFLSGLVVILSSLRIH